VSIVRIYAIRCYRLLQIPELTHIPLLNYCVSASTVAILVKRRLYIRYDLFLDVHVTTRVM